MGFFKKKEGLEISRGEDRPIPIRVVAQRSPTVRDWKYPIGVLWIDQSTDKVWMFTKRNEEGSRWTGITAGALDMDAFCGEHEIPPIDFDE